MLLYRTRRIGSIKTLNNIGNERGKTNTFEQRPTLNAMTRRFDDSVENTYRASAILTWDNPGPVGVASKVSRSGKNALSPTLNPTGHMRVNSSSSNTRTRHNFWPWLQGASPLISFTSIFIEWRPRAYKRAQGFSFSPCLWYTTVTTAFSLPCL